MSNFKKVLILIAIFSMLLPLKTVSADMGPKPTMDFVFQQQVPGAPLAVRGETLFECEQPDCRDAAPLKSMYLQRFYCYVDGCHATAYGFSQYHRLEIQFSDGKTRTSNIFQTAHFNSVYKVTIRTDDLLVEPQFTLDVFSDLIPLIYVRGGIYLVFCGCLAGILVLVILLVIFLIRRSRKKK